MLSIQKIALYPAECIIRLILILFDMRLEHLPYHWQLFVVGFTALLLWGHAIKFLLVLIKRRIFGIYDNGGS